MTARKAKTIRNLTRTMVHLRLNSTETEKPYRVELQPRGRRGDYSTVPAKLTGDGTFLQGEGHLFEVIPLSEAHAIDYGEAAPTWLPPAELVTPDQNTVSKEPLWDGKGRIPQRGARMVGAAPQTANVPGSDAGANAAYAGEGSSALPEGAFAPLAGIEKAQG